MILSFGLSTLLVHPVLVISSSFHLILNLCHAFSTLLVHHPAYQGSVLMLMNNGLGSIDTDTIRVLINDQLIMHCYKNLGLISQSRQDVDYT